ncbi:MAG: cell wall hydrolase [Rhizobiaceae bacterium]
MRRTIGFGLALGLAGFANIASTKTVSLQDIADLTGAKTGKSNRWLAHLVSVPKGGAYEQAGQDVLASEAVIAHAMAVQTAEAMHSLERDHIVETGGLSKVNRSLKGDRVFEPKKEGLSLANVHSITVADPIVTGSVDIAAHKSPLALASTFRRSLSNDDNVSGPSIEVARADLNSLEKRQVARIPLAPDHMNQARSVARMMSKALAQAKAQREEAESLTDVPAVTTAYAPTESKQQSEMASAFAAVLRPSLKKSNGVVKITLGPGDHKWAANPLPRYSFSKAERHCLANGIYFEARGEPKIGQKAVAQVILNRVRNPAYPKTICGVVYQNKRKRNACQFSFACDGIRDRVNSRKHWRHAVAIANKAIDGKFWLKSVGSSSHYHADYVWPKWRRKMRKMTKIGRHIFYRTYGGGWS